MNATSRREDAGPPLKGKPANLSQCEVAGCATGSARPLQERPSQEPGFNASTLYFWESGSTFPHTMIAGVQEASRPKKVHANLSRIRLTRTSDSFAPGVCYSPAQPSVASAWAQCQRRGDAFSSVALWRQPGSARVRPEYSPRRISTSQNLTPATNLGEFG